MTLAVMTGASGSVVGVLIERLLADGHAYARRSAGRVMPETAPEPIAAGRGSQVE